MIKNVNRKTFFIDFQFIFTTDTRWNPSKFAKFADISFVALKYGFCHLTSITRIVWWLSASISTLRRRVQIPRNANFFHVKISFVSLPKLFQLFIRKFCRMKFKGIQKGVASWGRCEDILMNEFKSQSACFEWFVADWYWVW